MEGFPGAFENLIAIGMETTEKYTFPSFSNNLNGLTYPEGLRGPQT